MNYDDYNVNSLKILAWKNSEGKEFPFRCATCDEATKCRMNCAMMDKDDIVLEGDEFALTTCPVNYILPQHKYFLEKYHYLQEFIATAPKFEDQQKIFWDWYAIYKSAYTEYEIERQKQRMNSNRII